MNKVETLAEADRLRSIDPARALHLYARLRDDIDPADIERLLWICDQVAPTPPPSLEPLLRRVVEGRDPKLRRAAIHTLATNAWYGGRREEAEALYLRCLHEPAPRRDKIWIRACLNLANVMGTRRCVFEPLVLTGMGRRAAVQALEHYLQAYAACRLADIFIQIGDLARAERSIKEAEAIMPTLPLESKRRVIRSETLNLWATYHTECGDFERAFDVRARWVDWLEGFGHTENAVLASAHLARLEMGFEAVPEQRERFLEEFASIPERFALGARWREIWRCRLVELYMRYELERGDAANALVWAGELLDLYAKSADTARVAEKATELGRALAAELRAPGAARSAFDVAATASLRRILEAHKATAQIPELAEATPDDWETLARYRQHLADRQRELLDTVTANLQPGVPAFDVLAQDGMFSLCAWCGRVRTAGGEWLPIAHLLPPDEAPQVSHGICEECRDRHF